MADGDGERAGGRLRQPAIQVRGGLGGQRGLLLAGGGDPPAEPLGREGGVARGLPVLAAEVGGVSEALGHGHDGTRPGLLVAPGDPAAFGAALRTWLGDAELRGRLRRAARERRASLGGWAATTADVANVLEGVGVLAGAAR